MARHVASRRLLLALLFLAGPAAIAWSASPDEPDKKKVVPSVEAQNHVDETCTVEMTVKASKNAAKRAEYYLDSEEDFRDEKNFAVVISYDHADKFKQAGVQDPSEHYKGKTVRVTGKVIRENDQVRIRVEDPKNIEIVEAEAK